MPEYKGVAYHVDVSEMKHGFRWTVIFPETSDMLECKDRALPARELAASEADDNAKRFIDNGGGKKK